MKKIDVHKNVMRLCKQQPALFQSIRHWEKNKQILMPEEDELRTRFFMRLTSASQCALCKCNKNECDDCILETKCSRLRNPWRGHETNCTHMINYLKVHQFSSDLLIEPGV